MARTYKKIKTFELLLDGLKCNSCGEESKDKEGICWYHHTFSWGYGKFDGEVHEIDLCEDCYYQIVSKFKVGAFLKYNEWV